jgi:acyl-CoA thioester hydrolase
MDGVAETVMVHFEDLDAQGVVHNGRYVFLLERALAAFWERAGWPWDPSQPRFKDISFMVKELAITYHAPITRMGPVQVRMWLDHLGNSSAVIGFRVASDDESLIYAEGRRVQVRIDLATLRPDRIGPELREAVRPLLKRGAAAEPVARPAIANA